MRFAWRNMVGSLVERARPTSQPAVYLQEFPAREQVAKDLSGMMARGLEMLFVFSGESLSYFNYVEQLRDAFPEVDFGHRLRVELFAETDHLYALESQRQRLMATMIDWLDRRVQPDGGAREVPRAAARAPGTTA